MRRKPWPKWLSCKTPMRFIAVFVVLFLVSATVLYFYDTLAAAFDKLTWHDKKVIPTKISQVISTMMAIIIGLGVLAESAPTIWEKLIYWGQCMDNKLIKRYRKKLYFVDEVNCLLEKTRILVNQTNFRLQTITAPASKREKKNLNQLEHEFKQIYNNYCQIKRNSERIHTLLEKEEATDAIYRAKQEKAKNVLNTLIMENLQICDRIEALSDKFNFSDQR